MKPSELIREARNALFECGWYQGAMKGPDGSVCAMGAVACAIKQYNASFATYVGAQGFLYEALPDGWLANRVHGWNDAPERTFDEVVDLFDRAEKLAERDE